MNEKLLEALTAKVLEKLAEQHDPSRSPVLTHPGAGERPKALLVGKEPLQDLGYDYVTDSPYEAVVIGSLTAGQLLFFREEQVLCALLAGIPVYLYTPGLPTGSSKNRNLETELGAAVNRLRNWGVLLTDGNSRRRLITAQEARRLKAQGRQLPPGCILTPAARDILE